MTLKPEERRLLVVRAEKIKFRPPTDNDKLLFCNCGALRAQQGAHGRDCFLTEYLKVIVTAGRISATDLRDAYTRTCTKTRAADLRDSGIRASVNTGKQNQTTR